MGQQVNVLSEPKQEWKGEVKTNLKKMKKFNILNPKSSELIMNKLKLTDEVSEGLNSHLLHKMEMICDKGWKANQTWG